MALKLITIKNCFCAWLLALILCCTNRSEFKGNEMFQRETEIGVIHLGFLLVNNWPTLSEFSVNVRAFSIHQKHVRRLIDQLLVKWIQSKFKRKFGWSCLTDEIICQLINDANNLSRFHVNTTSSLMTKVYKIMTVTVLSLGPLSMHCRTTRTTDTSI